MIYTRFISKKLKKIEKVDKYILRKKLFTTEYATKLDNLSFQKLLDLDYFFEALQCYKSMETFLYS